MELTAGRGMPSAGVARGASVLVLALTASACLAVPATAASTDDEQTATYLVTATPGALEDVVDDLPRDGAELVRELDGIGVAVVEATEQAVAELRHDDRVGSVTPDSTVQLLADVYAPYHARSDANSMYNITDTVGARNLWSDKAGRTRWTGAGIDVAVLDSGITPVEGLATPGKIVNGPDLSFDSQDPGTRYLDAFGHGTHMAGIIAGRDTGADPATNDPDEFLGVAPDARLVNVKVADALGNADVSQIIAGIDWVVQHRRSHGLNIRVLNLSLGTPSTQSYLTDPLAYAAEQAWHQGIVVVAATGNDGTGTGRLLNPAQDPYVLAVGANDSRNTNPTGDDVVPEFSTRGDGVRNPDLVAHGVSVQSLRVPGSFIDEHVGATGAIDARFIRGSGTSQAAAVASGAVALLLQANPTWGPDEVKARLTAGARRLPAAHQQAQGHGMVDLRRVSTSTKVSIPAQTHPRARGTGSLDAARGGLRLATESGVLLSGERDVFGRPFDAVTHAGLAAAASTWSDGTWNGSQWTGAAMSDAGWTSTAWSGEDWGGSPWSARTWAGGTWTARTWADGYWEARTWAARTWAARTWAARTWASSDWQ